MSNCTKGEGRTEERTKTGDGNGVGDEETGGEPGKKQDAAKAPTFLEGTWGA